MKIKKIIKKGYSSVDNDVHVDFSSKFRLLNKVDENKSNIVLVNIPIYNNIFP